MGPSAFPLTPFDAENLSCPADLGFPSPAGDDFPLSTPRLTSVLEPTTTCTSSIAAAPAALGSPFPEPWKFADNASSAITEPVPGVVQLNKVVTPQQEVVPCLGLDAIVGAAVDPAPSHQTIIPESTNKSGPGLRLPSFDSLGIGNPRPDLVRRSAVDNLSNPWSDPLLDLALMGLDAVGGGAAAAMPVFEASNDETMSSSLPSLGSPRAQSKVPLPQDPSRRYFDIITPPDDNGRMIWSSLSVLGSGALDSPANTDPGTNATTPRDQPVPAAPAHPRIEIQRTDSDNVVASWLDGGTSVLMNNLQTGHGLNSPIKVLSHALPCPSSSGHAFPFVINTLHNQTPTSPTCWINVFHAVSGRFNLSDLPSSPPSTPGPPIGGDDYFTSKVFDSAVPVLDYQQRLTTLPRSPCPAVPPSSVNVSIVERYIPPSSANEFSDMFNINGRSLLVDRLVELSPDNGTLLFIYPTKQGANTFLREYLGPILDPMLRSMCVINGLSVDLGSSLGKMCAVDSMHSHDSLQLNISQLCHKLNQQSNHLERFHHRPATFSLDYASKQEVKLERRVWAESWWVKQEKSRVRDVVSKYFRMSRRLPPDADVTPTNLIHEVLDGVMSRPYGNAPEPVKGIEVSVFVIKRSR